MFKAYITRHLYDCACESWNAAGYNTDLMWLNQKIASGEIRIADEVTVGTGYGYREIEA